jgi:hypothetical protein
MEHLLQVVAAYHAEVLLQAREQQALHVQVQVQTAVAELRPVRFLPHATAEVITVAVVAAVAVAVQAVHHLLHAAAAVLRAAAVIRHQAVPALHARRAAVRQAAAAADRAEVHHQAEEAEDAK